MGGDDPEDAFGIEILEEHFGQGTAQFRVTARAEFVEQQQRVPTGLIEKALHPLEPIAVRGQLILDALVVPDVGQDLFEKAHRTVGVDRDEQSALDHGLDEADHLQGNGLAPCIRPADDEHSPGRVEGQVLRLDGQSLAPVGEQQQGVVSLEEFNSQILDNVGSSPVHIE